MSAPAGQETDPGKILFERFVDLWNGEVDFADTADFIADEFTVHSAELARYLGFPDSNHITTRDGLLDWVRAVRGLLHDVRFTTDPGPIRDGDHVAGGYTVTGTYAGGAPRRPSNPAPRSATRACPSSDCRTASSPSTGCSRTASASCPSWELCAPLTARTPRMLTHV